MDVAEESKKVETPQPSGDRGDGGDVADAVDPDELTETSFSPSN